MTQVTPKQEKQEKDDDIRRSKSGITDRDQEEMMTVGENEKPHSVVMKGKRSWGISA